MALHLWSLFHLKPVLFFWCSTMVKAFGLCLLRPSPPHHKSEFLLSQLPCQHSWFDGSVYHHPVLDVSSQMLVPVCSWVENSQVSWLSASKEKLNFCGGSSNFPYVSMNHFTLPPMSSTCILLENTASCNSVLFDLLLPAGWMKLSLHIFIFTWTFQQPLGYSYAKPSYKTWFMVFFLVNLQRDGLLCCSEPSQLVSSSEVCLQLRVRFCLVQRCLKRTGNAFSTFNRYHKIG